MQGLLKTVGVSLMIPALIAAGAIVFGGPSAPPTLERIGAAFDNVDFSGLPAPRTFIARDGESIAYRLYPGAPDRIVVALHGSSGSSVSLHPLAKAVSGAGPTVVALDIRGHGASGVRGDVDHIGQLEEDLDDLFSHLRNEAAKAKISFVGFSMGGGLALRFVAGRDDVEKLVLVSPYLAHDAPPMTAANPNAPDVKWATAGVARIVGLSMVNAVGLTAFNGLPVVRLAIDDSDREMLAGAYSYRLMQSVNPVDWKADLKATQDRLTVIASEEDGLHLAASYKDVLAEFAPKARFVVAPPTDHMGLTLDAPALALLSAQFEE